jgi:hypothetical protein
MHIHPRELFFHQCEEQAEAGDISPERDEAYKSPRKVVAWIECLYRGNVGYGGFITSVASMIH